MINEAKRGFYTDRRGTPIQSISVRADVSLPRPGVFLDREAAEGTLAEYPAAERKRWRLRRRTSIVDRWKIELWYLVPTDGRAREPYSSMRSGGEVVIE